MAQPSLYVKALILKKTKLGETDLIVSYLNEQGERGQAIARGARKPRSSFAARLEIQSMVEMFIVQTKGIPIVKEARLIRPYHHIRKSYERSIFAEVVIEAAQRLSQEYLEHPVLFQLTTSALDHIEQADESCAGSIACAYLIKAISICGYKPVLTTCIRCGQPLLLQDKDSRFWFNLSDGGAICASCPPGDSSLRYEGRFINWLVALLYSTFDDLITFEYDKATLFLVLQFCQAWCGYHLEWQLKSVHFVLNQRIV